MFLKEISPIILYDLKCKMAMEQMKGKWASSRVDLGYTELFCIPDVTSVFFSYVTVFLVMLWSSIK